MLCLSEYRHVLITTACILLQTIMLNVIVIHCNVYGSIVVFVIDLYVSIVSCAIVFMCIITIRGSPYLLKKSSIM